MNTENNTNMENTVESQVVVTPNMILKMLEEGKDRDVIGKELGLSKADVKLMFQHSDLKSRKVKKVKVVKLPGFRFATEVETPTEVVKESTEVQEEVSEWGEEPEDSEEQKERDIEIMAAQDKEEEEKRNESIV